MINEMFSEMFFFSFANLSRGNFLYFLGFFILTENLNSVDIVIVKQKFIVGNVL